MTTNERILAKDATMTNDTRRSGINNNDIIIGPSGAGKTRSYVKPNIMQCSGSMIVTDTKGDLHGQLAPLLQKRGYRVLNVDFIDMLHSDGYNPLDYIRRRADGTYSEHDVMTLCAALVPVTTRSDPFWELSARILLSSLVGYVLECLPREEQTLEYVVKLFTEPGRPLPIGKRTRRAYQDLLNEHILECPDSFACRQYKMYSVVQDAERTESCIMSFLTEKLAPLSFDGPVALYRNLQRVDFNTLGEEKTAVFLNVSDTDRSMDALVNIFYTQALHTLCAHADNSPTHRLKVPVRFIFDDFATNANIPDFDKIISVIRSREIYASIILQSITQLEAIYGREKSQTILNNCDNCLYLGGQDVETARYMALKANKTVDTILNMPLEKAYLFTRGQRPREVVKFDVRTHIAYPELSESENHIHKEESWNNGLHTCETYRTNTHNFTP